MKRLIVMIVCALSVCGMAAQNAIIQKARVAKEKGGAAMVQLKAEMEGMLKSGKEQDMIDCANGYYYLGEVERCNEVREMVRKKFPAGMLMRNEKVNDIYKIEDAAECEKAYKKWLKTYPVEKLGDDITYDYAAYSVALLYAEAGNEAKTMDYLHRLTHKDWIPSAYHSIASAAKDRESLAEKVYKEAIELCEKHKAEIPAMRNSELNGLYNAYGDMLYAKGRMDEALAMYEKTDARTRGLNYGSLILKQGRAMQAFSIADKRIRKGDMGEEVTALAKEAWMKANGNMDGYDEYMQQIKDQRMAELKAEIAKSEIKEKAPDFEIKDIEGNTVSLADFAGKVVVLDFWATWCGPCKRSFPAMKKAVDKYKWDKDVTFLFIHTWERGSAEEAYQDAKTYLQANGYTDFTLLMDTKVGSSRTNKAVTAYKVTGIPAKFVIDKAGNIRFKISGFGGNDDEAVEELSMMIEIAKK